MTLLPPAVKVHLAFGYIDMRKGSRKPVWLATKSLTCSGTGTPSISQRA